MGSLGGDEAAKKAMWLYPKTVTGFNPSERWGHSACFFQGLVYVFGGCCGGLHFSDILVLNLDTMAWTTLVTGGQRPGPRDSHSAVRWGNRIIVFGGTNGSKKVNDLHILDLKSQEWTRPVCIGAPPSPRESHTATLVGGDKVVVFGGSGDGLKNYLNDLHVLDLNTMMWTSPKVKGETPPPRDSHVSFAIGSKIFIYGGDCGDRYLGDVDVLDMETMTWSRLITQGPSPGMRAGHAAVTVGTKAYIIGGVGNKKYYNDSWVLDTTTSSWSKLDICGQHPQGRFSHTAVFTGSDIAIYGGCGEDERPLRELLVLQLGSEHPHGRYNVSLCKNFGKYWNQGSRRIPDGEQNGLKTMLMGKCLETDRREPHELHPLHSKRRRTISTNPREKESEREEHSLSLSQHSSPSQSDQEQTTTVQRPARSQHLLPFNSSLRHTKSSNTESAYQSSRNRGQCCLPSCHMERSIQNPMGVEVQGKVDGVFDSGYLITATLNGRLFRGVLFAPGPNVAYRGTTSTQNPSSATSKMVVAQPCNHGPTRGSGTNLGLNSNQQIRQAKMAHPSPIFRGVQKSIELESRVRSDLQGVVLSLGGPQSDPV